MFCENCGTKMVEDANVCEECGFIINPSVRVSQSEEIAQIQQQKKGLALAKNINKKKLGIIGGIVGIVLAAVFLIVNLMPYMGANTPPILYLKGEGLFAMKENGKEPYLISEDAHIVTYNFDYESVYITEDGTKMFYADDYDSDNETYDIYMRDLRKEKTSGKDVDEKGLRIASNVSRDVQNFQVVEDGKYVIYFKDSTDESGAKLYINNLEEEIKIDSDVWYWTYGDDLVFYQKYNYDEGHNTLYMSTLEADPQKEKVAENVLQFEGYGRTAYYITSTSDYDENTIYMKEFGKDKVKLDEGIIDRIFLTGEGNLYYQKAVDQGGSLYDFVNDDMLEEDGQILEPDMSDYETEEYVDGFFGYYLSTVTDYESYYEARDIYYEKEDREYLRDALKGYKPFGQLYSIFIIDKGNPVVVSETASEISAIRSGEEIKGLTYIQVDAEYSGPVVSLSEIDYAEEVYDYMDGDVDRDLCVALGATNSVIQEGTEFGSWATYLFGNTLACLDYDAENLFVAEVSGSTVSTLKSLDHDVTKVEYLNKDTLCYYKQDASDWEVGDYFQYVNEKGNKLASDVLVGSLVFLGEGNDFAYISDYNYSKEEGSAYFVKNGKDKVRLGDDIHSIHSVNGSLYFLQDFSTSSREGELRKFIKEGTVELIDEEVVSVIM